MPGHLVLIGFMGSGKSTVGRRAAELLDRPFVDIDQRIEEMTQMSIAELFATDGEARFRLFETGVLAQALDGSPSVIAPGGGAPTIDQNWRAMLDRNLVIHLAAEPEALLERIGRGDGRPLAGGGGLDVETRHEQLLALLEVRQARYLEAPNRIDTTGRSVEEVAQDVAALAREQGLG